MNQQSRDLQNYLYFVHRQRHKPQFCRAHEPQNYIRHQTALPTVGSSCPL